MFKHVKVPGFGCTYPQDYSDQSDAVDFRLVRLVQSETFEHKATGPTFVLVIEAGRGLLKSPKNPIVSVDFERIQFVPELTKFAIEAQTPILKVILLTFSSTAVKACMDQFKLPTADVERVLSESGNIPRTTWVNEVCHRYAFERSIANERESLGARFLESEIVKEYFYSNLPGRKRSQDVPFFVELEEPLRKALEFIERNLHDSVTLPALCKISATSKSTLVRLFKDRLKTSPIKYLWTRRLEEADRLLITGRFTVAQVASITGFSDPSTFSTTYKTHFKKSPSAALNRRTNAK